MMRFLWPALAPVLMLVACTSKSGPGAKATTPSANKPEAFFTGQKAWCTVQSGDQIKENSVDRFEEVFVFKADMTLNVWGYDLNDQRQLQWTAKSQPKLKSIQQAKFRVEGAKLILVADTDRASDFAKMKRTFDGKEQECFALKAGSLTTIHCPCQNPEELL